MMMMITMPTPLEESAQHAIDAGHLLHAARLAVRGHGHVEPNPPVGCVIVNHANEVVGEGWHQRYGGPHAEINALRDAGVEAAGATAYLTLEPCTHQGKTGPCSSALIEADIARVVIAARDPHELACGGVDALRSAGIEVEIRDDVASARMISRAFTYRVQTGLPWVTAKWAQTLDGRVATRTRASQWISSVRSRRVVHRERGRVDVILTGIGTVIADDPLLTARSGTRRRIARRVVIDPNLLIAPDAQLVETALDAPLTVVCDSESAAKHEPRVSALRDAGAELIMLPAVDGNISLRTLLAQLVERYDATTVLVEAGPRLLGRLFAEKCICEAWVFIAPKLFGDAQALPPASGLEVSAVAEGVPLRLIDSRRRADDLMLRYLVGNCGEAVDADAAP